MSEKNEIPSINMNMFSIIIPVYNTKADLLIKCIESIVNQTYRQFECIIVDDGSDDVSCIDELKRIEANDSRFSVVFLEHHGNSYARNHGIDIASGDYLMFVDADDVISPFLLDEANEIIEQHNPDMVMGLVKAYSSELLDFDALRVRTDTHTNRYYTKDSIGSIFDHILGNKKDELMFDDGYISGGPVARVIRASVVKKTPFPGGDLISEDVIWNCVMLSYLNSVIITPNVWYGYYHYSGSKSRKTHKNGVQLFNIQVEAYCSYISKYWPDLTNGLYMKLWQEIAMFFRIYLNNTDEKWAIRYQCYKDVFKKPAYIQMINQIDFSNERNTYKRMIKSFTRSLIKHKIYLPTWFIWKTISEKAL